MSTSVRFPRLLPQRHKDKNDRKTKLTIINNNLDPPKIHPSSQNFRNNKYPNLPLPKLSNSFIPLPLPFIPMNTFNPYPLKC